MVCPVTRRSGKHFAVVETRACSSRLSEALFLWAWAAIQNDLIRLAPPGRATVPERLALDRSR
jgi:hypothetical protein